MPASDTALPAALQAVYHLVEQGLPPNGIAPDDCGSYAEVVHDLYDAYEGAQLSTETLRAAGRTDADPHQAGVAAARETWIAHVRLNLSHEAALIEAMRQATATQRPRKGLLQILEALEYAADEDARKRMAHDLVDDAGALAPNELLRLKDALKTLGLPAGWIKEWVSAVRSAARGRRESAKALVAAPLDEATDDQKATWPYLAIDGRMLFCAQRADLFGGSTVAHVPIADFTARIVEEQTGEDGRKLFLIEGTTVIGRPFTITMEAEEFSDDRRLKAALTQAAGAQAPIYVGMAKHLGAAIQRLSGEIASIKRYTRTGWADGVFLLPGRTLERTTIVLGRKLPYGLAEADITLGMQALDSLLLSHGPGCGGPVLSFVLTPPLALLANWRNERHGGFIAGRTGSFKTSMAQLFMSIFGPNFARDDLLAKWGQGATNNALMAMAVAAYDLPFLIDNYKPNTGDGPKAFVNLIHNIVEGGEKDRLTRSSELRDTRPVFAWPLVTGEDVPDRDTSSLARILIIPFTRPTDLTHMTRAQRLVNHLCAIGRSWIEWIESDASRPHIAEAVTKFDALRQEWGAWLIQRQPKMMNPMRVGSNLAINELTWAIAEQHPVLGPLMQRYADAYYQGLTTIALGMARRASESSEAARYLSLLRQALQTGELVLINVGSAPSITDENRMIGYRLSDDSAYLLPEVTRARIERLFGKDALNNISSKTLYDQLEEMGALASQAKDRRTRCVRVGPASTATQVLHLAAHVLVDEEDIEHQDAV